MNGGEGESSPPSPTSGGKFLLQLLQKPPQNQAPSSTTTTSINSSNLHPHQDPAVAGLGSSTLIPFPPWQTNTPHDSPHLPSNNPFFSNFLLPRYAPNPWGLSAPTPNSHFPGNPQIFSDDLQRLGFLGSVGVNGESVHQNQNQKQESMLMFGSLPFDFRKHEGLVDGNLSENRSQEANRVNLEMQFGVHKVGEAVELSGGSNSTEIGSNSSQNWEFNRPMNLNGPNQWNHVVPREQGGVRGGESGIRQQKVAFQRSPMPEPRSVPPGFPQKSKGVDQWGSVNRRQELGYNVGKEENHRTKDVGIRREEPKFLRIQGDGSSRLELSRQIDRPGLPIGSNLHSVPALDIEESLANLHGQVVNEGVRAELARQGKRNSDGAIGPTNRRGGRLEHDDLAEQFIDSLRVKDGFEKKNDVRQYNGSHDGDFRSEKFRLWSSGQRMRNHRREVICRGDISSLNAPLLAIYESLVPAEEEKAKQKQLLTFLEKLVNKEWPHARLYLYGSCANSFGVSNSDIDVCLAIDDADINKSELLLKLADILQSDNLQNVQALTRARVPIVKLMDPVTGISCDICVNNVLAVVNTKLLRDYAQIDVRLRQLAFIVKHWAKSRGVNETYQGTLSSYAYVLMCIHFLQQRKPAILPCLQGMEASYAVTVDDIKCAYFDQVEKLHEFGAQNKESIAQLVWAFFNYWAYGHDYANTVISVRTGSIISKRAKDWTRRIGNDRHLICIEDPFETSHDLGRVVDKYSINILREEFERAANIMQFDPDPCITLFEPFVPS